MASNGVILLNLGNRNAAEFQRLSVPDSYEKASGALTAGTYVTVYKWLYQGFMLAPSLCDAVDATDHINLVDRTNGGIISVYPDDTITVEGGASPEPTPTVKNFRTYHITSGSKVEPYSLIIQKGHYVGEEFDWHWNPEDIIPDGDPVEVTVANCTGINTPYLLRACCTLGWSNGWILRSVQPANEYVPSMYEWVGTQSSGLLHMWTGDEDVDLYYCEDDPGSVSDTVLVPLTAIDNGSYNPLSYQADGFSAVSVEVPIKYLEIDPDYVGLSAGFIGANGEFQQWTAITNYVEYATLDEGKYLVCMDENVGDRFRVALFPSKSFSDFEPYISEPASSSSVIYSAETPITPISGLSGDGLTRRFIFQAMGGVCVIMTSAASQVSKPILLKIEEE